MACLLPEKRSEILEMILPERLLAQKEDKVIAEFVYVYFDVDNAQTCAVFVLMFFDCKYPKVDNAYLLR